ncbi:hypothetical protein GUJ93_ZPchr0004g38701 [Zizania palustris]|uniref:Uncharacterized protein n=1 Tax=Zizania palustris TaxID=103762 RepID=A0A8J5RZF6_ZIZPA|nr:hypothetical protein GUJ93_ZPchr0004g38701 [Zizania palustris]
MSPSWSPSPLSPEIVASDVVPVPIATIPGARVHVSESITAAEPVAAHEPIAVLGPSPLSPDFVTSDSIPVAAIPIAAAPRARCHHRSP